jgi:hypothetical protein
MIFRFADIGEGLAKLALAVVPCMALADPTPVATVLAQQDPPMTHAVTLSGVVGYSADCQFRLYADQASAAARREGASLFMAPIGKEAVQIGAGYGLETAVGHYVLATGALHRDQANLTLSPTSVYFVFGDYGKPVSCAKRSPSGEQRWLDLREVLQSEMPTGVSFATTGVLGDYADEGLALFIDRDAAHSGVWANGILLRFAGEHAGNTARAWKQRVGEYVTVSGISGKPAGRSGFKITIERPNVVAESSYGR